MSLKLYPNFYFNLKQLASSLNTNLYNLMGFSYLQKFIFLWIIMLKRAFQGFQPKKRIELRLSKYVLRFTLWNKFFIKTIYLVLLIKYHLMLRNLNQPDSKNYLTLIKPNFFQIDLDNAIGAKERTYKT